MTFCFTSLDYHLLTKKRCEKDLIATEVDELIVKVVNLRKNCPGKIAQSTAAIKKLELHRLVSWLFLKYILYIFCFYEKTCFIIFKAFSGHQIKSKL